MKAPHLAFAAVWVARYFAILTLHVVYDPLWLTIAAATFFPIEAIGLFVNTGKRDQLSELWTWTIRRLSKHERAFTGWNWLVAIFAALEAGTLYRVAEHWGFPQPFLIIMCLGLASMLHAHWLRPDIHG